MCEIIQDAFVFRRETIHVAELRVVLALAKTPAVNDGTILTPGLSAPDHTVGSPLSGPIEAFYHKNASIRAYKCCHQNSGSARQHRGGPNPKTPKNPGTRALCGRSWR